MKKQAKKNDNEILSFLRTFLVAFVIISIIATPISIRVGKVLNETIGSAGDEGDQPVLKEELAILIDESSPFFEAFTNAEKVNVLLLGINGGLTDTIMLASLDTKNKRVDVISIPRDTYYQREGYNSAAERKVNAAYRKNPVNTAKAVSEILMGIPINYYMLIDEYDGVKRIVDAMGGVPMDIPFHMQYNDPYDKPPLHIDIPKGEQILDGEHAIQFLRYRHGYPEGDLGRVKAQQQFMKNAFKQCIGFDLPKIATAVYENIKSDIKLKTVLYLVGKSAGITSEDITTYMLPNTPDPKPPYYVYPKQKEIADMLTEIYSIERVEEETTDGAVETVEAN